MEVERPQSKFRKTPAINIIPAGGSFNESDGDSFLYKADKTISLYKKILSGLYRQVGSFFGYPAYFFSDVPNNNCWQQFYDIIQKLKDRRFIQWFRFNEERFNDAPPFYSMALMSNHEKNITDGRAIIKPISHGFGQDIGEVFSKTIGEFLERYFLTLYHKKNFLRATIKDLKKKKVPFLDLSLLAGFSDEQKRANPKLRFDEQTIFYWERVKRLSTGKKIYVPAQLVYWNYGHDEAEPFLCEGNTNGAGGMFTKEGAILAGIYELIQRDAFLIYWLNQITPRRIDPRTVPHENFQKLLEESERYGFEIYCLNIVSDIGAPAFAVIVSDPSGQGPRFCLGVSCRADPAEALWGAFEEAWSIYYWIRATPPYPALGKNYQPFREQLGQEERLRLWGNPKMAKHLKFFVSGREEPFSDLNFNYPQKFSSQKEELNFLVKKIESFGPGYEIYYYQPKCSFLSEVSYHSAQVIVPKLVHIYLREFHAPLGSIRLKEVPPKIGFETVGDKFNPWPHPFP